MAAETIALIREMAAANRQWDAERIRGELLKLGFRVATTTAQRHLRDARPPRRVGQPWATFLRDHAFDIWACYVLPVTVLLFRPRYAFFVIAHASRRVVHIGVTRHPNDAWVAQQLREATPFGQQPRYRIRDNDRTIVSTVPRFLRWPRPVASRSCGRRSRDLISRYVAIHDQHVAFHHREILVA